MVGSSDVTKQRGNRLIWKKVRRKRTMKILHTSAEFGVLSSSPQLSNCFVERCVKHLNLCPNPTVCLCVCLESFRVHGCSILTRINTRGKASCLYSRVFATILPCQRANQNHVLTERDSARTWRRCGRGGG